MTQLFIILINTVIGARKRPKKSFTSPYIHVYVYSYTYMYVMFCMCERV